MYNWLYKLSLRPQYSYHEWRVLHHALLRRSLGFVSFQGRWASASLWNLFLDTRDRESLQVSYNTQYLLNPRRFVYPEVGVSKIPFELWLVRGLVTKQTLISSVLSIQEINAKFFTSKYNDGVEKNIGKVHFSWVQPGLAIKQEG